MRASPWCAVERLEAAGGGAHFGASSARTAGPRTGPLLRTIAGQLAPLDGWLELGQAVQVGYLAQIRAQGDARRDRARYVDDGLQPWILGPARSYLGALPVSAATTCSSRSSSCRAVSGRGSKLALVVCSPRTCCARRADEPLDHSGRGEALRGLSCARRPAPSRRLARPAPARGVWHRVLWVVDEAGGPGEAARLARYPGGFSEMARRARPTAGAVAACSTGRPLSAGAGHHRAQPLPAKPAGRNRPGRPRPAPLSKDAYRRRRSGRRGRPDAPRPAQEPARAGPWPIRRSRQTSSSLRRVHERAGRPSMPALAQAEGRLADARRAGAHGERPVIPPIGAGPADDESPTVLIGLTGPIGCGKSTRPPVCWPRSAGAVIDADDLAARPRTGPKHPALPEIRQRFGDSVFQRPGRARPRGTRDAGLQATAEALADLEQIVHPRVRVLSKRRSSDRRRDRVPFVVIEGDSSSSKRSGRPLRRGLGSSTARPVTQRARLTGRGARSG